MFPWLALKLFPNIAFYIGLQNRGVLYGVLGMAVCLAIGRNELRFKYFNKIQQLVAIAFGLFIVSIISNIFNTINTGSTAEIFPTGRGLFMIIALPWIIKCRKDADRFIFIYTVIICFVQFAHFIAGSEVATSGAIANSYDIDEQRIVGISDNPWTLSYNSIVAFGIALITLEVSKNIYVRTISFSILILSSLNLILTVTRGALVGLSCIIIGG